MAPLYWKKNQAASDSNPLIYDLSCPLRVPFSIRLQVTAAPTQYSHFSAYSSVEALGIYSLPPVSCGIPAISQLGVTCKTEFIANIM